MYRVWGVAPGDLFLAFDKWGVDGVRKENKEKKKTKIFFLFLSLLTPLGCLFPIVRWTVTGRTI